VTKSEVFVINCEIHARKLKTKPAARGAFKRWALQQLQTLLPPTESSIKILKLFSCKHISAYIPKKGLSRFKYTKARAEILLLEPIHLQNPISLSSSSEGTNLPC
jgi:hypothetical protein